MAISPAQLTPPQNMPSAEQVYFTCVGGARIDKVTISNPSADADTVTLQIVPSGSSPDTNNTLTFQRAIAAGQTWNCPDLIGHILNRADTIQGNSGAGNLTIMISGITIT